MAFGIGFGRGGVVPQMRVDGVAPAIVIGEGLTKGLDRLSAD